MLDLNPLTNDLLYRYDSLYKQTLLKNVRQRNVLQSSPNRITPLEGYNLQEIQSLLQRKIRSDVFQNLCLFPEM